MSYNGSGVFQINTAGQPVVAGTVISDSVFNALTADLATGLSTAITKDGQTVLTANIPMAGFKLTGLGIGTATTDSARVDNCNAFSICEVRLSLTSGSPVTTSDVTAATTVYVNPYKGRMVALYNGTNWVVRECGIISVTVPATTSTNYDVFLYDNSGTVSSETVAWTNDTTRATALTTQSGVYVKSGDATRRYIGSFRTTTVSGQTEDSLAKRYVWNYYNRIPRSMSVRTTSSWSYTTATLRQANASTTFQLDMLIGVSEDVVNANVIAQVQNGSANVTNVAIGVDSTTTQSAVCIAPSCIVYGASAIAVATAAYSGYPGVGKHSLTWLEWSGATGTTTWGGPSNIAGGAANGIFGTIMA